MIMHQCQCCKLPIIMCHKLAGNYGGITASNTVTVSYRKTDRRGRTADMELYASAWVSYDIQGFIKIDSPH